ncbi:hypothetical protein PT2222_70073 [Paraburkholderia tropica]
MRDSDIDGVTEIDPFDFLGAREQFVAAQMQLHDAFGHDGRVRRHAFGDMDVLFDGEHGGAVLTRAFDHGVDETARHRGAQAEREFVEQHHARTAQQRTRHSHHLLLAAAQLSGAHVQARFEFGEDIEQRVGREIGEAHVFRDRERGKQAATLDDEAGAAPRARMRRARERLAVEQDLAFDLRQEARDGEQRRRLARAVAAEQRDDLARVHVERDVAQDLAAAIARAQPAQTQYRRAHARAPLRTLFVAIDSIS